MCVIERDGKVVIIDQTAEIERLRNDLQDCGSYVGIGPGEGDLPIPERVRRCVNRLKETQHKYEQNLITKDARIAELESQIIQQTGISASRMEERERLQKQIAALQEIAVEERASMMACSEYEPPVTDKRLRGTARDQLAEEHPEAFG